LKERELHRSAKNAHELCNDMRFQGENLNESKIMLILRPIPSNIRV